MNSISLPNSRIGRALAAGLCLGLIALGACSRGPSITVGGTTFSESDLEKQRPREYAAIKKEYEDKVLDGLSNLATQKLIDLEAEEQGKSGQDYLNELRSKTPPPSEAEMREMYASAEKSGRLPKGATFESMRDSIAQFMMNQSGQETVRAEIQRLKKKYNYTVNQEIVRQTVDIAGEPVRMNPEGQITVVEFSDFDCFYCKKFQPTGQRIREKYGDKVKWVVKDFPLTSIHPEAMAGHIAANCVYKQKPDKFWDVFDTIVSQDRPADLLQPAQLRKLALAQGVDGAQYDACVADPEMEKEVRDDMEEGSTVGVNGTPAFFINGRFINGAVPYEDFEAIIEEELN